MTVARPPQPSGDNFKTWGTRLNEYLVRTRSQLAQFTNTSSAINDGMLVWDAENSRVLYSNEGVWIPIAGTTDNFASLYYDGSAKITATADGVTAFGNITLSGFPESDYELKGDIDGAVRFHAVATEALSKGDVVYIVEHASSGSETKVAKALASDAAKMPAFGLALDDAAIDAAVQIVTFGNLYGSGGAGDALDTSAYNSGTPLYVSATTAGEWTGTAPTGESNLVQNIGKVVRKQQTNGVIKVGGAGRTNATPNLNDGNIFIGNSNNEAVTASLATQVSTLETSHDDVLVDGDFTSNGFMKRDSAGVYSVDGNTYLTTHQDISGKADLSGATFTGTITAPNVDISTTGTVTTNIATGDHDGSVSTKTVNIGTGFTSFYGGMTTINIGTQSTSNQNTVNIGSGVSTVNKEDTINLKGNVTVDGTLSGLSHNHVIPLFQGYSNLGSSPAQIGDDFYLRNYNNKHYKRFVEVNAAIGYSGTSSTNDLNVRVILVAPSGSGSAIDIGSVVSITSTSIYNRDIVIAGDVTHWFSDYAGVGANSNGATPFTSVVSAVYNPTTDQTTFNVGVYGATIPSTGDSIYVHPFDWESAGSEIYGHIKQFDVDAEASMNYTIYSKVYFGNIDRIATCRIKFYETASSDSVNIQRLQVFQIDESV